MKRIISNAGIFKSTKPALSGSILYAVYTRMNDAQAWKYSDTVQTRESAQLMLDISVSGEKVLIVLVKAGSRVTQWLDSASEQGNF